MPIKDATKRREYHREYSRSHYKGKVRADHLSLLRKQRTAYLAEQKPLLEAFRNKGCAVCNEDDPCCLCGHHLNPETKEFEIARIGYYSTERFKRELAKCVCLCRNCHDKLHAGHIELPIAG